MNTIAHAHPCWADLSTNDVDAAEAFSLDETPIGRMIPTPPHLLGQVPDNWSVYFNVVDCAATEWRAVADPTGSVFQVMQYAEQIEGQPT